MELQHDLGRKGKLFMKKGSNDEKRGSNDGKKGKKMTEHVII